MPYITPQAVVMVMLLIVSPPNVLLTTRQRDTDLLTANLPQIREKSAILRGNVVPESEPRFD